MTLIEATSNATAVFNVRFKNSGTPWEDKLEAAMKSLTRALNFDHDLMPAIKEVEDICYEATEGRWVELLGYRIADHMSRMFEVYETYSLKQPKSLLQKIAELEAALEPFRSIARHIPDEVEDAEIVSVHMNRQLSEAKLDEIERLTGSRPNAVAKLVLSVDGLNAGHFRATLAKDDLDNISECEATATPTL